MFLKIVITEKIDVKRIDHLPIIAFNLGTARIQQTSHYYMHHFNVTSLKTHVEILKIQFEQLKPNQFTSLTKQTFEQIHQTLENLAPSRRQKRWNSLGTAWKFIAGSPDANDLKILNSSINDLISNNNQQVRINRALNLQLKELVFKTKDAIELSNSKSLEIYSMNILLNLKYLAEKLEQIVDSISLAKAGILNEKILSQDEIEILYHDVFKQNITVHNAVEALNFADTTIATNGKELTLLIKTPILDKRIFNKIHVFPVTNNHKQIHLTNRNYLTHETGNYMVNTLQPTIYKTYEVVFDNSRCIPNLLFGNQATCNYTMNPPEDQITIINDENIILNSDKNISFTSTCGLKNRTFTGTFLITFHDCEININNISYSNEIQNMVGSPIQLPLDGITIQKQLTIANLSLEHLHHLHLEMRKEMEYIRLNNTSIEWPAWSIMGGIISFPCMIIGIVILLKIFSHRSATVKIKQIPSTTPTQEPLKDIQPNPRPMTIRDVIRTEPHL
ncbi:uncharacterized protein LOC129767975 [Toxorhynchites rutilus septentrionalis]|uniref:uncharacterized protein LOC129767975 n=1 Tax=Toxorhynchites rutilus septentrionalis TaxID=329112 RepID=UPI002478A512|nr:uncharacterized protein LOC129767975 [Toxorhynchites rutilus septentrionalis]